MSGESASVNNFEESKGSLIDQIAREKKREFGKTKAKREIFDEKRGKKGENESERVACEGFEFFETLG